jgi:hypothetical protein
MGARTGTFPEELLDVLSLELGDVLLVRRGNTINVIDPNSIVTAVSEEDVLSKFYIQEAQHFQDLVIAYGDNYTGTINLGHQYRVLGISTAEPMRLRIYTSELARDNDINRSVGSYVPENSGLVLEFISSTTLLSTDLNRLVDGFSYTEEVYFSLQAATLAGCSVDFTIKFVKTGIY